MFFSLCQIFPSFCDEAHHSSNEILMGIIRPRPGRGDEPHSFSHRDCSNSRAGDPGNSSFVEFDEWPLKKIVPSPFWIRDLMDWAFGCHYLLYHHVERASLKRKPGNQNSKEMEAKSSGNICWGFAPSCRMYDINVWGCYLGESGQMKHFSQESNTVYFRSKQDRMKNRKLYPKLSQ